MTSAVVAFVVLMVLLVGSGASSVIRKKKTSEDYLVASRGVPAWLTALSAVATNNSGFMFIGMIAYTYSEGIESIWMMVGWVVGDLVCWIFIHPRVRKKSEDLQVNTLSTLIGTRAGGADRVIIAAVGVTTFVFLCVYAAAQLKAGATALHALFGWQMWVGIAIGAAIVILYSFAGGIRADIWTDAAQSAVMFVAMVAILAAGVLEIGGPGAMLAELDRQDPLLTTVFPDGVEFGPVGFILGFAFAGFGVAGQPHIMTRLMALSSKRSIRTAGAYYFLWYVPFFLASIGVGLYCRAIMPELTELEIARQVAQPTELALPLITMELLPEIFVGIALAGLFAATVSTADSQIIVCSGAVTQDVQPRWKDSYAASKTATFAVTAVALGIATWAPQGVFGLVLIAWSALGASLAPLLALRLFKMPLPAPTAVAMLAASIATVGAWHVSGYDDDLYKILPGTLAAMATYGISRLVAVARR